MSVPLRRPGGDREVFDADAFYRVLDAERAERQLTWKDVAAQTGVSPSTLTRLGQGRRPDVESFARLVAWGGFSADQFVYPPKNLQAGGFITNLPTYLRSDPNLDERGAQSLEAIIRTAYDQFRRQG